MIEFFRMLHVTSDSITTDLAKLVEKAKKASYAHTAQSEYLQDKARKLMFESGEHESMADELKKTAKNIKSLLGR